ncbi:MAG TPA: membrane protein insertion efficiency factor YidD [Candidatus Bipolaricaulota bacterium]
MPRRVLAALVLGYQRWISPLLPARCRFYPSCSAYALQALERYGALKGSWMALKRLARCGPWSKGGYDPLK